MGSSDRTLRQARLPTARFSRIERRLSNGAVSTACIISNDADADFNTIAQMRALRSPTITHNHNNDPLFDPTRSRSAMMMDTGRSSSLLNDQQLSSRCASFDHRDEVVIEDDDLVSKLQTSLRSKSMEVDQLRRVIQDLNASPRHQRLEDRSTIAERRIPALNNAIDALKAKLNDAEAWTEQVKHEYEKRINALQNQIIELSSSSTRAPELHSSLSAVAAGAGAGLDRPERLSRSQHQSLGMLIAHAQNELDVMAAVSDEREALVGALRSSFELIAALESEVATAQVKLDHLQCLSANMASFGATCDRLHRRSTVVLQTSNAFSFDVPVQRVPAARRSRSFPTSPRSTDLLLPWLSPGSRAIFDRPRHRRAVSAISSPRLKRRRATLGTAPQRHPLKDELRPEIIRRDHARRLKQRRRRHLVVVVQALVIVAIHFGLQHICPIDSICY